MAFAIAPWVVHYFDHPPQMLNPRLTLRHLFEWPVAFTGGGAEAVVVCAALIVWGQWSRSAAGDPRVGLPASDRSSPHGGWGIALRRIEPTSWVLLTWLFIPLGLLLAYSLARHPVFGPRRYFLFVGPAYLLLLARGVTALPRVPRLAAAFVGVMVAGNALGPKVYDTYRQRPDLRNVASVIQAHDSKALVVVVDRQPGLMGSLRYYLTQKIRLVLAHDPPHLDPRPFELVGAPSPSERAIWFVREAPKGIPSCPSRRYSNDSTPRNGTGGCAPSS